MKEIEVLANYCKLRLRDEFTQAELQAALDRMYESRVPLRVANSMIDDVIYESQEEYNEECGTSYNFETDDIFMEINF